MDRDGNKIAVYIETGSKRSFAGAIDWPGWCRSGRDETSAIAALIACGPRYGRALQATQFDFEPPIDVSAITVTSRLKGDSTTDFGSPAIAPAADQHPIDESELLRFKAILVACWRAFETAVGAAQGLELRRGPRGGGRDLGKIIEHVQEANVAYLARLGWKHKVEKGLKPSRELEISQNEIIKALEANAAMEEPGVGPRGGVRWMPRYFVRRVAWHLLDHAWEIEDRIT